MACYVRLIFLPAAFQRTFGKDTLSGSNSWGCGKFISLSQLKDEAHELLPDDTLTIGCRVSVENLLTATMQLYNVFFFREGIDKYVFSTCTCHW